ncbi:chromosome segregation protein SMC [Pseudomonas granadensis]|uniref:Chromosome segregation protein SMC n=1 Tax=Pseudomonas granadensis TaxID=1421430 RepID=A0ABX7GDD2_9PSED|nr:chromosome segregation protein SMC [Pseudomonas granadensis]MBN6773810.1 chromosome segregation protein SMC [Pseudomonas granadensis]MBN6804209.1 chromosome segregation protein SMC [Pseudomonas granadensis]MBN6831355.1 chromosome segregation protein SMC [Pseudomonas granadensis]MBN6838884.1 chromosome segregation protein SMC [Pseudomonas granadensis]MBN6868500.1 chromosome segregation protein SMC [Pseudomonas granadensis]
MNEFQASTERHALLTSEVGCSEAILLSLPNSDSTLAAANCEKKQRLIDEIDQLTTRRDKYLRAAEEQYAEMAPLEALLEGDEELDANRLREVRTEYNTLKRPYDSNKHHAWILDAQITRREQLLNHETLMAGYTDSIANWKADELELNEKRDSLSTRLVQVQQQAEEDMAKARQAETDAATAYAQAVAWGDTEGEKNANTDAQKAAKNLATAIEHNRRQHLIINALEQELVIVDQHIAEAQREHIAIQRTALLLAEKVLEEQWNEKAQALMEMGAKLWAAQRLLGGEHLSLMKLVLPKEGEDFHSWNWHELADRSGQYSVLDILSL